MKGDAIEILLIEDNHGDIKLTREALLEYKFHNNLHVATDGSMALDFLYRKGKYNNVPKPDVIILDLGLPKVSGHEILIKIKNEDELKDIPVVILTSSENKEDIEKAYDNYANCYLTKPLDFNDFIEIVRNLNDFWISIVALPGKKSLK